MTFSRFVIFAGMRTGSNLLEATLNQIKHVTCFGEAFNPYMMGWPDKDDLKGVTRAQRDENPHRLLDAIFDKPNHLAGFRYFFDHDPRVFDAIMDDRNCAKIILTRNPLDSYVSTRLAWKTDQWKLNEAEIPKAAAITYDGAEFRQTLADNTVFLARVQNRLQHSGQTAFWLGYDDLRDSAVLSGLLHWLGRTDLDKVCCASDQVPQNPREMAQKVANYAEMTADLAQMDPFDTGRIIGFEPTRGPAVPSHVATDAGAGMLFMPVRGGPDDTVRRWLRDLGETRSGLTQNMLRRWKREHPDHRSFTVLRHPLRRAWTAYQQMLVTKSGDLRQLLREVHRVDLPPDDRLEALDQADHHSLFAAFLDFLKRNLHGQTTLPVHPIWASQSQIVAGFGGFAPPDLIAREETLAHDLAWLAESTGIFPTPPTDVIDDAAALPGWLNDGDLAKTAREAYLRDYVMFGFADPA